MRRSVVRFTACLAVLASAPLFFACSAPPSSQESLGETHEAMSVPRCGAGYTPSCTDDTLSGIPLCTCVHADAYYTIPQLELPPSPEGYTCTLETSPRPYPTALDGLGCTQTAFATWSGGASYDVWFCPIDQWLPPPYEDGYDTTQCAFNTCLGAPPSGWYLVYQVPPDTQKSCPGSCIKGCFP